MMLKRSVAAIESSYCEPKDLINPTKEINTGSLGQSHARKLTYFSYFPTDFHSLAIVMRVGIGIERA